MTLSEYSPPRISEEASNDVVDSDKIERYPLQHFLGFWDADIDLGLFLFFSMTFFVNVLKAREFPEIFCTKIEFKNC